MIDQAKLEAAAEAIYSESSVGPCADDLAQTADTIGDFIAAQGQPYDVRQASNGLTVHIWEIGRKVLAVVDCGEQRAAYSGH